MGITWAVVKNTCAQKLRLFGRTAYVDRVVSSETRNLTPLFSRALPQTHAAEVRGLWHVSLAKVLRVEMCEVQEL